MKKTSHMLRVASLLSFLLLIFQWASAQTGTVKGTVKDIAGHPLAGASVAVEGKRMGASTDEAGNYSLRLAPGQYMLVVSFVGQSPQRIPVTVTAGAIIEHNFSFTGLSDLDNVV